MNKLLACFVASSLALLAPGAHALPSGRPFEAFVGGEFAGTIEFELDAWIADGACRYLATWDRGGRVPAETCFFDEATRMGYFGCLANAAAPVWTLVVLTPGQRCHVFDPLGQDNAVFRLLLAEDPVDGSLFGIIQFTAAIDTVEGLYAAPLPAPAPPPG